MMKTLVSLRLLSLILICGMEVCVFAQTPTPNIPKLDIRLTQKDYKTVPENFEAVCRSAAMGLARHFPERKFKPIRIEKANHQFPVKLERLKMVKVVWIMHGSFVLPLRKRLSYL